MTRRNMRLVETPTRNTRGTNEHCSDIDHLPPKKRQKYMQAIKKEGIQLRSRFEPKSFGQEFYLTALNECDITFCGGPAGTGKTWIATRFALEKLLNHEVERIVVTKPILEAGDDHLGFIPGEIYDKILPHFMSVLSCIEDHIGPTMAKKLIDDQTIEFLPAAYARGRSIKNSFMLIDEAQNMTRGALRLMLSRIASGSQLAINGDYDQIDLPNPKNSGFEWAMRALTGKSPQIGVVELTQADIQRHELIGVILTHLR